MQVLFKERHARLLREKERICAQAGLRLRYLSESMSDLCSEAEVFWVRDFEKHRAGASPGMVLMGKHQPDIRCQLICAAFIRNYIDARVIPVNSLFDARLDVIAPTVMIIPNLFLGVAGKGLASWKVQELHDKMVGRFGQNKLTVVCIQGWEALTNEYGKPFADFLRTFDVA